MITNISAAKTAVQAWHWANNGPQLTPLKDALDLLNTASSSNDMSNNLMAMSLKEFKLKVTEHELQVTSFYNVLFQFKRHAIVLRSRAIIVLESAYRAHR